jgi:hypothetical protein
VALAKLRDRAGGEYAKRIAGRGGSHAAERGAEAHGAESPAPDAAPNADSAGADTAEPDHHLHNAPGQ